MTFSRIIRTHIHHNLRDRRFSSADFVDICKEHNKKLKSATQMLLSLEGLELIKADGYIAKPTGGPSTVIYIVAEDAGFEIDENRMTHENYRSKYNRKFKVMYAASNKLTEWLDGIERKRLCN